MLKQKRIGEQHDIRFTKKSEAKEKLKIILTKLLISLLFTIVGLLGDFHCMIYL